MHYDQEKAHDQALTTLQRNVQIVTHSHGYTLY